MLAAGNRRRLLLTEEEKSYLAEAVDQFHVPRSFLILEAVQAGLKNPNATTIPGRRNKQVGFRLPADVAESLKQTALARGVSQQSLLRHLLFTYLSGLCEMRLGHPK